jgi:hypothetical protein
MKLDVYDLRFVYLPMESFVKARVNCLTTLFNQVVSLPYRLMGYGFSLANRAFSWPISKGKETLISFIGQNELPLIKSRVWCYSKPDEVVTLGDELRVRVGRQPFTLRWSFDGWKNVYEKTSEAWKQANEVTINTTKAKDGDSVVFSFKWTESSWDGKEHKVTFKE